MSPANSRPESRHDIPAADEICRLSAVELGRKLRRRELSSRQVVTAFLNRIDNGGVSEKELSELLARDLLIPVAHGVTYDEIRAISPLLGSRNGLSTEEDSMEDIAKKVAELVDL